MVLIFDWQLKSDYVGPHPTKRADSNSGPFRLVPETRTTCNAIEIPHAFEPPAEFPGKKLEMQILV